MTKIEWVGRSWNPVTGCTPVSEGCKNCYAERMAKRMAGRFGYPKKKPFQVTTHTDRLDQPQNWRKPSSIFVCSMGDLFHESLPFWAIDAVIGSCMAANWHTYIFLTKRPVIAYNYFDSTSDRMENFQKLKGILGVTAENQAWADKRIPILLQIPAAIKFVNVEPMLGPVDLTRYMLLSGPSTAGPFYDYTGKRIGGPGGIGGQMMTSIPSNYIQWIIAGCESGPKRRTTKIEWLRYLRDQCDEARVPFFLKQMVVNGIVVNMPEIDGQIWAQYPGVE